MRFEIGSLVSNFGVQAHDLKAAGVGKNWVGPVHKLMNSAELVDVCGAGAQIEMIVVGQNNLGAN